MHVLFIEDNPRDVELARLALARSGLNVGFAAVPDEDGAADYLLRRGEHAGRQAEAPVVVFLDLKLGGLRRPDLIATIRSYPGLAWLPVVMLTASDFPADVAECYRHGANAYVVKPVGFAGLVALLRRSIRVWAGLNVVIGPADGPGRDAAIRSAGRGTTADRRLEWR